MIRWLGLAATFGVILFWVLMNGLLVRRVLEYRGLDEYRRGVIDFLGGQVRRERRMGIYRHNRRIGTTQLALERTFEKDALGYRIEFSTRVDIDLLGRGDRLVVNGAGLLDARMVPESLTAEIGLGEVKLRIEGRRDADRFLLVILDGEKPVFQHPLPLQEFLLGDGLAPSVPIAGLRSGETYRVAIFDPIFRESDMAEVTVLREVERPLDVITVDCYLVETRFRGMVYRSYVTKDGEVLRQELPPPLDVVLKREEPGAPMEGKP